MATCGTKSGNTRQQCAELEQLLARAAELTYDEGYLMLSIFRVRVCRNCGECQAVWGWAANILFMLVFRWFWDGKVHLDGENP